MDFLRHLSQEFLLACAYMPEFIGERMRNNKKEFGIDSCNPETRLMAKWFVSPLSKKILLPLLEKAKEEGKTPEEKVVFLEYKLRNHALNMVAEFASTIDGDATDIHSDQLVGEMFGRAVANVTWSTLTLHVMQTLERQH